MYKVENIFEYERRLPFAMSREMENISRGPTFGDFVTEGSMQLGHHGCKTTGYMSADSPLLPLLNVMYCVRVSLWTVNPFATLKRRGSWVISVYLWQCPLCRFAAGMWFFFALIMISSYTANLAAFLTVETLERPIESAEDLANQDVIKYGALNGGSTAGFFENSNLDTYQRLWQFMSGRSVHGSSCQVGMCKAVHVR
jgi:hypothetical protein